MQHGRDHDERKFHYDHKSTRRHGRHADDEEEVIPPDERAPAMKDVPESGG